jgi:2-desacetyl-2-hydroxyethyl bacteriochlorophyllide A dehydrogenase
MENQEMKAIANIAPGRLKLMAQPLPRPGPGWVRIRTRCVGVCSTDLKMIAGWKRTGFPAIPGHEWSGIVDAAGQGVNPALVGRLCVADNIIAGGEVGFEHPGAYAEFFLTRAENLYPLPDRFPAHRAALIEPLAVCVHALDQLPIEKEKPALLFGDGPIGLLLLALLRLRGVKPIWLVGGLPNRLAMARSLGASEVFDYHEITPPAVASLAKNLSTGFPVIFEASGSADALDWAFHLAPHGGHILVLGDYEDARASFRWNDLLHREIHISGSNASAGAWLSAVRLAIDSSLPLEKLITHRLPYTRYAEAVRLTGQQKDQCIKVILDWSLS